MYQTYHLFRSSKGYQGILVGDALEVNVVNFSDQVPLVQQSKFFCCSSSVDFMDKDSNLDYQHQHSIQLSNVTSQRASVLLSSSSQSHDIPPTRGVSEPPTMLRPSPALSLLISTLVGSTFFSSTFSLTGLGLAALAGLGPTGGAPGAMDSLLG